MQFRITIVLIMLLLACTAVVSQPCLPDGYTFNTQSKIDSFQYNYPGCTEIEGWVYIEGGGITNLNGLIGLTSVGYDFFIYENHSLSNLIGLDSLTFVGGSLVIYANNYIPSLTGLNNLTTVGGELQVSNNPNLHSLTGLESLSYVGGGLEISFQMLDDFLGLSGLDSIGGHLSLGFIGGITDDFTGLEGLTSIGGNLAIGITDMNSLNGLQNINSESIESLFITDNDVLSTCEIQSICNYLLNPNGTVDISGNATGCKSKEEVLEACSVGIDECDKSIQLSVYPNPFTTSTTIEYELTEQTHIQLTIYNHLGEAVEEAVSAYKLPGVHTYEWNAERLSEGIYFAVLRSGDEVSVMKLIKH